MTRALTPPILEGGGTELGGTDFQPPPEILEQHRGHRKNHWSGGGGEKRSEAFSCFHPHEKALSIRFQLHFAAAFLKWQHPLAHPSEMERNRIISMCAREQSENSFLKGSGSGLKKFRLEYRATGQKEVGISWLKWRTRIGRPEFETPLVPWPSSH